MPSAPFKVALVAGGLGQGGAEKQLLYMARALRGTGVDVRGYCLTRGDHYERAFIEAGVRLVWIGHRGTPPFRLATLVHALRRYRPEVVHAGHFFTNLYAAAGAALCGAVSIGAIRNDGAFELAENRGWGPWLMRAPTVLMANSRAGAVHGRRFRRRAGEVLVLPNVIDVRESDAVVTDLDLRGGQPGPIAAAVGRLVPAKRFDRFLVALAQARRVVPALRGVLVGDGPLRPALQEQARALGLDQTALRFTGARADVSALLRQCDLLVSASAHEGFPNVLLEAMAARLPVVTTPAGDASTVIEPGVTGLVVPPDGDSALADAIVDLASHPVRRMVMGRAGRTRLERCYSHEGLAARLLAVYGHARRLRGGTAAAPLPAAPADVRLDAKTEAQAEVIAQ